MGKILSYPELTLGAAGDPLFIGDISTSASNPEIKYITTDNLFKRTSIWAADGNGLSLYDDGSNLGVFIKDGGNVGIGTSSADATLHLKSSTTVLPDLKIENTNDDANGSILSFYKTPTTSGGVSVNDILGRLRFVGTDTGDVNRESSYIAGITEAVGATSVNGAIGLFTYVSGSASEKARLSAAGNLLLATAGNVSYSGPDNYQVIGSNSSTQVGIYLRTGTSGSAFISFADNSGSDAGRNDGQILYSQASRYMAFQTAQSEAMRITSAGYLVIGNTSASGALHVKRASSGNVLYLENSSETSAIIQLKNSDGNSSYITRASSNLVLGAASAAGSTTVNIAAATGYTHFGGTDSSFRLQVSSSDYQISRVNGTNAAGGVIALLSDQTNPTNLLLSFGRTVSSTANVNWIVGNFYSSASYFGIHWKNATLNDTNAKFDTSTATNNLFYLDTSGNEYLGKSIKTHNKTNTGHNMGRFIQVFSYGYAAGAADQRITPLFSSPSDTTGNDGSTEYGAYEFLSKAPADGRIVRVDLNVTSTEATANLNLYTYTGGSAPVAALTDANCAYKLTMAMGGSANTSFTVGYSDFSEQSRLDFSEDDFLALQVDSSTGNFTATINVAVEFLVPETL